MHKCEYEVHVYTGNKKNAGTDSNVNFVLFGTYGDTGTRCMKDGVRQVTVKQGIHVLKYNML